VLTRFDDYPIHQTPEPLAIPASTDRHVYDRYWFNGYADDGSFYFGVGAAVYPNLGIMDCGLSLVIDGVQYAFHASRRAPAEPSELEVGPFRIDIQEPMKFLRVVLDDNETGISAELAWTPRTANFVEGYQRTARTPAARAHMEATRFNQFGRWGGEIRYDGRSLVLDPARTFGTKDRSWGIRPVGDPAPPGAPSTAMPQIFFVWAPLHWPDRCTHGSVFENAAGVPWHWDAMVLPTYDDPSDIPGIEDPATRALGGVEHELSFRPGSRRAQSAVLTLIDEGGKREAIDLEPLLCFRMKGIGYQHPEWGHGRWKGELAMAGESWRCDEADDTAYENQHVQQVVRARSGGDEGIGVLEQIALGPHARYGLTGLLDPPG